MTSPSARPLVVWFRDDLRTADNPALHAAAATGRPVVALYVLEDTSGPRPLGGASRWWLAGSLRVLAAKLASAGVPLTLRRGRAIETITSVVRQSNADTVFWNRRYGNPAGIDRDIETTLQSDGVQPQTFNGSLLFEPGSIRTKAGGPVRVFTPFWRNALSRDEPQRPLPAPKHIQSATDLASDRLDDWALEPTKPDWAGAMRHTWNRGEDGARKRLTDFLDGPINGYATGRDRPDLDQTSRLSPHLRFGEVSPRQIWHAARAAEDRGDAKPRDVAKFLAELGWREFSYHLLDQFPDLAKRAFQQRFDAFPWRQDEERLALWQRGLTGYPLVDAGMRELWQTGYMHNRVRMVVASFLVKHLLIDWRQGEQWFWDTLVDADPANNPASWQWVAGSGADAAPYFRVFNPTMQGEKFDPEGNYIRRWVPELARVPVTAIHQPAPLDAPAYPQPIVDHARARARALEAFASIRSS